MRRMVVVDVIVRFMIVRWEGIQDSKDLMVFYRVVMDLMLPFYKAVSDLMVMYLMLPLYKAVVDLSKDWLWLSIMSGSGFGEILFEISPSSCK